MVVMKKIIYFPSRPLFVLPKRTTSSSPSQEIENEIDVDKGKVFCLRSFCFYSTSRISRREVRRLQYQE